MVGKFVLHNHTSSGETQYYCSTMRLLMCSFEDMGLPHFADICRKTKSAYTHRWDLLTKCQTCLITLRLGKTEGLLKTISKTLFEETSTEDNL